MAALLAILLAATTSAYTQNKTLTLKEAVTGDLSPRQLPQLSWIPRTTHYAFAPYKNDTAHIEVHDIEGNILNSFSIGQFQQAVKELDIKKPNNFTTIHWIDSQRFWTDCGGAILEVNIHQARAVSKVQYESGAAHKKYNQKTNTLAYTIDNNLFFKTGTDEPVQVTALDDENIVAGQAIARFEFGITGGIFFSPNGEKIAFYVKDQTDVTDFPGIDFKTDPASASSFPYPMAGDKSEKPKVGVYDIERDQLIYLKTKGPKDHYLTNLAWGPLGKTLYVAELNRDQDHMKLNRYDAFSGALQKTLFQETDDRYVEPEHPPYFVEGTNDEFVWISERDGYNQLYLYDTDGELIRRLTRGDFKVKEIVGAGHRGKWLYFLGTSSPLETVPYRVKIRSGKMQKLAKTGTHSLKVCDEDDYLLDSFNSMEVPRRISLTDEKGSVVRNLLEAEDPLEEYKMGKASVFKIKGSGEDSLYARLIKPSDFDKSKKYPVLVYVYNGPHVQLIQNRYLAAASKWMYYMAEQGYLVFTVDGRGSNNRGIEFEQNVFRQLGTLEIQDQLAGVDYLKSLPYVDGSRLAVHGWSFGGFMTLSLMLREAGTFQVGVAGGAVTDWSYYEVMYTERYMDTPEQNKEGYDKADLKNYANNLEGDLLLIHDLADKTVVLQHNITLARKFIDEGVQFDEFYYPGHAHNVRGKDRVHLMRKILDYVRVHNK